MKAHTAIGGVFVGEADLPIQIAATVRRLSDKLIGEGVKPETVSHSTFAAQHTIFVTVLGFK